jgi:putative oxidoreductase
MSDTMPGAALTSEPIAVRSRAGTVVRWILQILLAVVFLGAGGAKLAGAAPMVQMYDLIGFGQWFRYATGFIEVGSAILLLVPSLAALGAVLLACTMVGAIIAHYTVLHMPATGPIVLLCLAGVIAWLRRADLVAGPG